MYRVTVIGQQFRQKLNEDEVITLSACHVKMYRDIRIVCGNSLDLLGYLAEHPVEPVVLLVLAEEHIKVLRDCKSVFPTETPYLAIKVLHGEIPGSGYVVALHTDMYVKLIICAQPAQQVFQAGFVGLECSDGKVVVLVGICALIKFISVEFAYAGN